MNLLFPKVPSGIPGLDKMIGGGFTKNSVIVLSGSTGSGRTTFATQFLVNGYRQNQEPGIFLSFNEPKYSIFANMSAYDWNLPDLERNKQVVFIEYPSSELTSFIEQEGSILELIDTLGVERVVFDSITPLAMLADGDERVKAMQKLVNVIRKWGVSALITADDITPPDPDLPRTSVGIESMTDGYIHLGWMREGNRRLRTLEVVKMRGSAHAHLIHLTTIDSTGYHLVDSEMPETQKSEPADDIPEIPKLGAKKPKTSIAPAALTPKLGAKTDLTSKSEDELKSLISSLSPKSGATPAPKTGIGTSAKTASVVKFASKTTPAASPSPVLAPSSGMRTLRAPSDTPMPSSPITQSPSTMMPPASQLGIKPIYTPNTNANAPTKITPGVPNIRQGEGPKSTTPVPKPPPKKAPPKEPED